MSLAAPAPAGGMRMDAGCDTTGASTCFAAPGQRWTHLHKDRHIAALDASSVAFTRALTGEVVPSLAVSGSAVLGELHVFDAATGASVRQLEGHIGGVGACRFFPNGNLVISGGADLTLKIWTIAEGLCAATFRGHAGRITSLGIIGMPLSQIRVY
jgi:WD40 repeat protein